MIIGLILGVVGVILGFAGAIIGLLVSLMGSVIAAVVMAILLIGAIFFSPVFIWAVLGLAILLLIRGLRGTRRCFRA